MLFEMLGFVDKFTAMGAARVESVTCLWVGQIVMTFESSVIHILYWWCISSRQNGQKVGMH